MGTCWVLGLYLIWIWQEGKSVIKRHVKKIVLLVSVEWAYLGSIYELNTIAVSYSHSSHFSLTMERRECGTMRPMHFMYNFLSFLDWHTVIGIYLSGFSKAIASVGYIQLAHVVIEAEKSPDVQLASWRPRRDDGVVPVCAWRQKISVPAGRQSGRELILPSSAICSVQVFNGVLVYLGCWNKLP